MLLNRRQACKHASTRSTKLETATLRLFPAGLVVKQGGLVGRSLARSTATPQAGNQRAALAALHRGHADNGLRFAILQPPAANRHDQSLKIRARRRLFAGELAGRDRVARLAE